MEKSPDTHAQPQQLDVPVTVWGRGGGAGGVGIAHRSVPRCLCLLWPPVLVRLLVRWCVGPPWCGRREVGCCVTVRLPAELLERLDADAAAVSLPRRQQMVAGSATISRSPRPGRPAWSRHRAPACLGDTTLLGGFTVTDDPVRTINRQLPSLHPHRQVRCLLSDPFRLRDSLPRHPQISRGTITRSSSSRRALRNRPCRFRLNRLGQICPKRSTRCGSTVSLPRLGFRFPQWQHLQRDHGTLTHRERR